MTPTVELQLPSRQAVAPSSFGLLYPSACGVPNPKISNFSEDSEWVFANLKLALDNLLQHHPELTGKYKYHVRLEHLKLPEAQMISQSCRHHLYANSVVMHALRFQYGQPHQLAQSEKAAIITAPDDVHKKSKSMENFAVLDDGAQQTMILPIVAQQLVTWWVYCLTHRANRVHTPPRVKGRLWNLPQRHSKETLHGAGLDLVEQTYPVQMLQKMVHSPMRDPAAAILQCLPTGDAWVRSGTPHYCHEASSQRS